MLTCTPTKEAPEPVPPPVVVDAAKAPEEPTEAPWKYNLGSYSTKFKTETEDERVFNIRHAASKLDGRVIGPGEDFSFNEVVGVRSETNGFKPAPVIFLGVLQPGIGGGVCQVSSTLHAAVLKAGLNPSRRIAHSRPSSYIMAGLDATVSFPAACERTNDPDQCYKIDYNFTNTYDFPLKLVTSVNLGTKEGELTIAVYSQRPSNTTVDFKSSFNWTNDPIQVRHVRTNKYRTDYSKQVQKGKRGRRAVLKAILKGPDGKTLVRRFVSEYPPVAEVWEVGLAYVIPKEPSWESSSSATKSENPSKASESTPSKKNTGIGPGEATLPETTPSKSSSPEPSKPSSPGQPKKESSSDTSASPPKEKGSTLSL